MKMLGVVLVAALLTGCGSASHPAADAKTHPSHKVVAHHSGPTAAQIQACRHAVGPLLAAENQVDARLNVGLQFADYTTRLGNISVAYNHAVSALKTGDIAPSCINKVGLPLQRAFNDYREAYQAWNACIQATYCTFGKGSPALKKAQAKWALASVALDSAGTALSGMR